MNLQHALKRLSENPLPIIAGGTDFYPALMDEPAPLDAIDIMACDELKRIECVDGVWTIGAGVTWTEVINADLPPAFDGLKAAAREVGSVQIQNRATVVGNLCNASPAADGVPVLLALNASVELQKVGMTRTLELSEFILGVRSTQRQPDELITAIKIPAPTVSQCSEFIKLGARKYLVISIAMLAINIDCDDEGRINHCAIAVGSCSPVAERLKQLEQSLIGLAVRDVESLKACVAACTFQELSPIDDVRGSAAYRLTVVRSIVERTLLSLCDSLSQSSRA